MIISSRGRKKKMRKETSLLLSLLPHPFFLPLLFSPSNHLEIWFRKIKRRNNFFSFFFLNPALSFSLRFPKRERSSSKIQQGAGVVGGGGGGGGKGGRGRGLIKQAVTIYSRNVYVHFTMVTRTSSFVKKMLFVNFHFNVQTCKKTIVNNSNPFFDRNDRCCL